MIRAVKAAAPLLAALLLSACGGSDKAEPPQTYALEENSLPSLTELVTLEDGFEFEEADGEDEGSVSYIYSKLSDAGKIVEEYTGDLETDYDCVIAPGSDEASTLDFSADSGQVLAAEELEDSDQVFLLTIQWEDGECTITPSLADKDVLPQQEDQSITLEEAVALIKRTPLSVLGLSRNSIDEYIILPQEGTVFLEDQPCLLINIYQAENHQFEQSYLLAVPGMKIYRLDRETGEAVALN